MNSQHPPNAYDQMTFEVANASGESIVKPTLPKNVLGEFQHFALTGDRYQRKNNPFEVQPPALAVQRAPVPPPAPVYTAPPAPTPVQAPRPPQEDEARLVQAMQQHLRLKAAHNVAVTVGELSGSVKDITGQSWAATWEAKYGNLMAFLRSNPEAFTVIKNKYVACKGQEDVVARQLERDALEAYAVLEEKQRNLAVYSNVPMVMQQQPQYYATSPSQEQNPWDAYNAAGYPPQQPQYSQYPVPVPSYQQQPPPQRSDSFTANRRDSNDWALPQSNFVSSFTPLDPFQGGQAPPYYQNPSPTQAPLLPTNDWWGSSQQQSYAPPPPMYHPQQQQQQQHQQQQTRPPVDPFAMSSTFNSTLNESNISTSSRNYDDSDDEDRKKNERKAARKAKKQQDEDERLARELQTKEFEEAGAVSSEWVILTTQEMRDLAEKEIGIDNVRIIAGFTVKKFGREGRPHQRKMWVTQSLTHLAWASSLLEGSHRGIELRHVTEITSGQITPTIARYTSDQSKVRSQCMSLVTSSRTLDVQACSVIQRDALVAALRAVVGFNHKYRPEKVDRDLTRVQLVGNAYLFKKKD